MALNGERNTDKENQVYFRELETIIEDLQRRLTQTEQALRSYSRS